MMNWSASLYKFIEDEFVQKGQDSKVKKEFANILGIKEDFNAGYKKQIKNLSFYPTSVFSGIYYDNSNINEVNLKYMIEITPAQDKAITLTLYKDNQKIDLNNRISEVRKCLKIYRSIVISAQTIT